MYHNQEIQEVLKNQQADPVKGLTTAEVEVRKEKKYRRTFFITAQFGESTEKIYGSAYRNKFQIREGD